VAAASRNRDGRGVDEAERGGEALALSCRVGHQLDAECLAGRRHRLAVASAAQDRQQGRPLVITVTYHQLVWTGRAVTAVQPTDKQTLLLTRMYG